MTAPDFNLADENGTMISLASLRGKTVVVYFYPKDDTPGCTKEACSLRDNYAALQAKGAVILGISRDNAESHRKFKQKYQLPFSLLSDPEAVVIKSWGAWGTKNMYGKISEGIIRSTFVIDPAGIFIKIIKKVSVETHGTDLLDYI